MENTLGNKAKFFAQYWGQKLLAVTVNEDELCQKIGNSYMGKYHVEMCHIKLKPLSSITDEELIIVSAIEGDKYTEDHIIRGRTIIKTFAEYSDCTDSLKNTNQLIQLIDYLRSKGYALPYMGLSVEKLQEYGWIKLKSE